jgi:hypothetical protein
MGLPHINITETTIFSEVSMSANPLELQNPLMQPVQFNERVYFTSHYFHAMYKANLGSKYVELKNFNKLIRAMETYNLYVEKENIIELSWSKIKKLGVPDLNPLFESNSYNPVTLIDSVAQLALSHHLDDEISKTISVTVNESAAKRVTASLPVTARDYKAALSFAKMIGLTGNEAILTANRMVEKVTGVNLLSLADRSHLMSESQERVYTPTEIGKELGMSAIGVNKLIEVIGYQLRDISGNWVPTEVGSEFSVLFDSGKKHGNGSSIQQLKWKSGIMERLRDSLKA